MIDLLRIESDPLCSPPAGVLIPLALALLIAWTYGRERHNRWRYDEKTQSGAGHDPHELCNRIQAGAIDAQAAGRDGEERAAG